MFLVRSREVPEHKRVHSSHTQHIPLRYEHDPTYPRCTHYGICRPSDSSADDDVVGRNPTSCSRVARKYGILFLRRMPSPLAAVFRICAVCSWVTPRAWYMRSPHCSGGTPAAVKIFSVRVMVEANGASSPSSTAKSVKKARNRSRSSLASMFIPGGRPRRGPREIWRRRATRSLRLAGPAGAPGCSLRPGGLPAAASSLAAAFSDCCRSVLSSAFSSTAS